MKNLKLELFNFKKDLSLDQEEISVIIEGHMNACNEHSEKTIIKSLNERLKPFTYDKEVKKLIESLNDDMSNYELLYELKNLYNVLNSQNQGEIYRQPINVVLQTINLDSDQDRMAKILNELAIYDWVPEIKLFVHNLTKSPEQKTNLCGLGGRKKHGSDQYKKLANFLHRKCWVLYDSSNSTLHGNSFLLLNTHHYSRLCQNGTQV